MGTEADQIKLDFKGEVPPLRLIEEAERAREHLLSRNGKGKEFLGWLDLPVVEDSLLDATEEGARLLRGSEALVIVGIGGSYLGARAVIDALRSPFDDRFPIYFAGHHLDANYHATLLRHLSTKRYALNVISKSGTTTEPGIAFRLLWNDLSARFGEDELHRLVIATTDAHRGALRHLADLHHLQTFIVPDDVGGRYSVLTPVGLLPIAAAGLDIRKLIAGARDMRENLMRTGGGENRAVLYAAFRNGFYRIGKKIELFASFSPPMAEFLEWWKQLYGESEGKEKRGIFPASVQLTTDLHSMGQWIQDGERTIFETVLDFLNGDDLTIPSGTNEDELEYLAGRPLHDVNRIALLATMEAHRSGGVAGLRIEIPDRNEYFLGALIYFFEFACGISAYMLGVNPFDQPGVEEYKKNMFRMLGKPGS